jgi:hypothetical protein
VGLLSNNEYRGFFHACKRIYAEEGAIAFYRGYIAYILAVSLSFVKKSLIVDNLLDEHTSTGY